jgi:predicted  nucleic acid-binding Zn-ribbon protein
MNRVGLFIIVVCMLLQGCSVFPKIGWSSFKFGDGASSDVATSIMGKDIVSKTSEAERRVEEARKQMELDYMKFREDLQKAYDDRTAKDNDNFAKVSVLNYGVFEITREKKEEDINTLIAHLRSREIMARVDPLTDEQKIRIKNELESDKQKTLEELVRKYNTSLDIATKQKAELDRAEALIIQKEREKAVIRETNKMTIEKLERERASEIERIKRESDDKVKIAKEAERQKLIGWLVKSLGGIGILLTVIGLLMRSTVFITSGICCIGLAYVAATIPFWIVSTIMGLLIALMIIVDPRTGKFCSFKKLKPTVTGTEAN